jgi:hypothetical protein
MNPAAVALAEKQTSSLAFPEQTPLDFLEPTSSS